jgi:hypothetical protein
MVEANQVARERDDASYLLSFVVYRRAALSRRR